MGLTINDDEFTSDHSPRTARRVPGQPGKWEVSWLPGRRLDRNSAITAMILADETSGGAADPGHRLWPHIEGWAAELGLTGPDVLNLTAREPWAPAGRNALPEEPEAGG